MANKTICIEREYGSNGKMIAEWLSKSTGIQCYDKAAIKEIGKKFNLLPQEEQVDSENDYIMYGEAIKFLAEKRSCIFVGICAAAVLQGRPRNLNVFIKADMDRRIRWVMASEKLDRDAAEELLLKTDEKRREYRKENGVTEEGEPVSYDIIITSSKFGIEGTSELIRLSLSRI